LETAAARQLFGLAARAIEGPKSSLAELWDLEARCRSFSGEAPLPALPPALGPATDDATLIAALYGDAEATKLGYPPLGILP
jgi:hypothetical protein